MDRQKLVSFGVNYDEGLRRFANKAELYEKYIIKFLEDTTFIKLQQAMETKDYEQAFKCAHTVKGIAGNLSFSDFYASMCEFVEYLRNSSNIPKATEAFSAVKKNYENLIAVIKEST